MKKPKCNRALVELLMVVTIILIAASLPIPRLNKDEIPAHEVSALASIKAIHASEMMFASTNPDQGFTPDLATLGSTGNGVGESSIDSNLASARKSGYTFTYTPAEKDQWCNSLLYHYGGSRSGRNDWRTQVLFRRIGRDPLQRLGYCRCRQPDDSVRTTPSIE